MIKWKGTLLLVLIFAIILFFWTSANNDAGYSFGSFVAGVSLIIFFISKSKISQRIKNNTFSVLWMIIYNIILMVAVYVLIVLILILVLVVSGNRAEGESGGMSFFITLIGGAVVVPLDILIFSMIPQVIIYISNRKSIVG